MRYLPLLLFALVAFTTSCKQTVVDGPISPVPVDVRDRMVGTYNISYNVVIRFGAKATNPETYTGTLGVTKLANPSQLSLAFDAPGMKETLTAGLTDSTFTILDKKTQPIILNGTSFTGQFTGSGQFVREKDLSNPNIVQQKVTYNGVSEDTDLKLVTFLTGTKK